MDVGNTICTNSIPIHIKDIKKHLEFLNIINGYLKFTFKDSFYSMSQDYVDILTE